MSTNRRDRVRVPSYRLHRSSGQGVVTLSGRDHYCGRYGTPESRAAYDRLIAEWLLAGRAGGDRAADLTISELGVAYLKWAKTYYTRRSAATTEPSTIALALRPLRALYGDALAAEFGPLRLKAVRETMIAEGRLCRREINRRIRHLVRLFRWGAGEELVAASVPQALSCVPGLKAGRCAARETAPIKPVDFEVVMATLPYLSATVGAMVRIGFATGARPGELCNLLVEDIDRSTDPWKVVLGAHKTAHHGKTRVLYFGPVVQAVLAPLLEAAGESGPVFSPARSEAARHAAQRAARKSKVQPSQRARGKTVRKKAPGARYTPSSFQQAIAKALRKANKDRAAQGLPTLPSWSPNMLRHAAATRIRAAFGIEVARTVLGHSRLDVTEVYAERDEAAAIEAMKKLG
jgi:integrase